MHQLITETPTALANLEVGTWYFLQNHGEYDICLQIGATAPTIPASGIVKDAIKLIGTRKARGYGHGYVKRDTDEESVWMWVLSGAGTLTCELVYEEAGSSTA